MNNTFAKINGSKGSNLYYKINSILEGKLDIVLDIQHAFIYQQSSLFFTLNYNTYYTCL